jgi:hypothetical protein
LEASGSDSTSVANLCIPGMIIIQHNRQIYNNNTLSTTNLDIGLTSYGQWNIMIMPEIWLEQNKAFDPGLY